MSHYSRQLGSSTTGTQGDRRSQAPDHEVKDQDTIKCGFISAQTGIIHLSSK